MTARSAAELADVPDPAWPALAELAREARATVIPLERAQGLAALERLQVSARSTLGALALECGGIVADSGWFRILGGGDHGLPDIATASNVRPGEAPAMLLVAFDALGGRFAIDGGGLGCNPGEVCYFGPGALDWEGLGGGNSAFVEAVLTGAMSKTFAGLRWPGWESEVGALALDQGLSLYPPPFSNEGKDVSAVSRRAVPLAELHHFYTDAARQLG